VSSAGQGDQAKAVAEMVRGLVQVLYGNDYVIYLHAYPFNWS
jgi:hypothetical protein